MPPCQASLSLYRLPSQNRAGVDVPTVASKSPNSRPFWKTLIWFSPSRLSQVRTRCVHSLLGMRLWSREPIDWLLR